MAQPKLNWDRYPASEKLVRATYIVSSMTTNVATFATPIPALADVTTAVTELSAALSAAIDGSHNLTFVKNEKQDNLDKLMRQLMNYVATISDGKAAVILLSGMQIRKESGITPDPMKVTNPEAGPGGKLGQISLNWDSQEYVIGFQVERLIVATAEGEKDFWDKVTVSTKSKIVITGMEPGKLQRFRIAALGTHDRIGPFSQEVSTRAM